MPGPGTGHYNLVTGREELRNSVMELVTVQKELRSFATGNYSLVRGREMGRYNLLTGQEVLRNSGVGLEMERCSLLTG